MVWAARVAVGAGAAPDSGSVWLACVAFWTTNALARRKTPPYCNTQLIFVDGSPQRKGYSAQQTLFQARCGSLWLAAAAAE